MFCKRTWEIKKEVVTPSAWEQMKLTNVREMEFAHWMFQKTIVVIMVCTKCGKVHTFSKTT
jgi:hypothetical protein